MRRIVLEEPVSRAAVASRRVAVFAALVAAASALAARTGGAQEQLYALAALAAALLLAVAALPIAAVAAVEIWNRGRRGALAAATGAGLAAALLAFPGYLVAKAVYLPEINQVATDFRAPPPFSAKARGVWTAPPAPSAELEAAQRVGYPGVQPIKVDLEPDQAYRMSLRIAKELGWRVIEASPPSLRGAPAHIDAIDRTLVFGFTDDIAIRVRAEGGKSQIDLRSASRVGRHDFGANAKRVMKFIEAARQSVEAR